jgi:hypothetical protein
VGAISSKIQIYHQLAQFGNFPSTPPAKAVGLEGALEFESFVSTKNSLMPLTLFNLIYHRELGAYLAAFLRS